MRTWNIAMVNEDETEEIGIGSDEGTSEEDGGEDGETKKTRKTPSLDDENGEEEAQGEWALPDLGEGGRPLDPFGNEKPESEENEDLINEL